MNKFLFGLCMLIVLLVTVGCVEQDQRCAQLPAGGRYCLQPTTALGAFDAQQVLEIIFKGRKETIIAELESDMMGLRFVGLTPFGHKILQINYDNRTATALVTPDARLDPVLLVALLQLAIWPTDSIRNGLDPQLTLEETGNNRRILYGNEALLNISRSHNKPPFGKLHIVMPSAALELDIENLDASPTIGKEP